MSQKKLTGPMKVTLGEMLLIYRRRHGLSLNQLAEQLHQPVPASKLYAIENDELENIELGTLVGVFAVIGIQLRVGLSLAKEKET